MCILTIVTATCDVEACIINLFSLLYIYTKVSTGISVEIVGVTLKRTTKGRVTAFE